MILYTLLHVEGEGKKPPSLTNAILTAAVVYYILYTLLPDLELHKIFGSLGLGVTMPPDYIVVAAAILVDLYLSRDKVNVLRRTRPTPKAYAPQPRPHIMPPSCLQLKSKAKSKSKSKSKPKPKRVRFQLPQIGRASCRERV